MLIAEFTSRIPNMGDTKTYEDWSKYVGLRPLNFGVVARMFKENSLNYLLDGLQNVYENNTKTSKYLVSESLAFEWELETSQIRHIEFAAEPEGNGADGSDIEFYFVENYFQMYDVFRIDETKLQVQVLSIPVRKSDTCWAVRGRLMSNNYDNILDADGCMPGKTAIFQSVHVPELSELGYTKFQSSFTKYRNFISTFRSDVSWSSLYALQEPVFMRISDDKDKKKGQAVYKMVKKDQELIDTFMYIMNNGMLFDRGTVDKDGRSTITDPSSGRPIVVGDGVIPQIELAANKFVYSNKPTLSLLHMIMDHMAEKSQKDTGNHITFMVNRRLWNDLNLVLSAYLADCRTDGTYMYSKSANKGEGGYVSVGATFNTYEFAGNFVTFIVDRALTREYPTKGYGICIDLTGDKASNTPAIAKFTLGNGQSYTVNTIEGVGGSDGKTSGSVASNVAGSKKVMLGYGGVAVFAPYRSAIIYEA